MDFIDDSIISAPYCRDIRQRRVQQGDYTASVAFGM